MSGSDEQGRSEEQDGLPEAMNLKGGLLHEASSDSNGERDTMEEREQSDMSAFRPSKSCIRRKPQRKAIW